MEHILVNRVGEILTEKGKPLKIMDDNVSPTIIAISGIAKVRPIYGYYGKSFDLESLSEEAKHKIRGMSLETDLGGSFIEYMGMKCSESMKVLETPEAIYRKMEGAKKDFVLVHFVENSGMTRTIAQLVLPISKIVSISRELSDKRSISFEKLSEEERRQIEKFVSKDEIGGSTLGYFDEFGNLHFTQTLETPAAIYNRMYI